MARRSTKDVKKVSSMKEALDEINSISHFYSGTNFLKTGVLAFDSLFGGKGLPLGKVIEFSSREGVGKSTMMLHVCANLCSQGYQCLYIDAEFAVTDSQLAGSGAAPYMDQLFFISQLGTFGDISDLMDSVLTLSPVIIVIDSITAVGSRNMASENVESVQPGLISRLQATFLQKYKSLLHRSGTTLVLLNQMRTKLNFTGVSTEGPGGGNALKFYTDARFNIRRIAYIEGDKDGEKGAEKVRIGADISFEPLKNKIVAYTVIPATVIYGSGLSNLAYVQKALEVMGYLRQSSSFFVMKTPELEQTVRGRQAMYELIRANYDYFSKLIMDSQTSPEELPPQEPSPAALPAQEPAKQPKPSNPPKSGGFVL